MENTLAFAQKLDENDNLKHFRQRFYLPKRENGEVWIYFVGNSLGLQPKDTEIYLGEEMQKWANLGVEGHFLGKNPWFDYHKVLKPALAELTGAKIEEVTPMNSLTANLHFLLASFYQPKDKRVKILMEAKAFSSDMYVIESQALFHHFNPDEVIVELEPRTGEYTLRTEDILAKIAEIGDELALVILGGVNYYTGQFFDLQAITKAGQNVGAKVGFDLAHTIGNVPLHLHDWALDFAVWCSYKYLNSSPGGVGGIFVHQKHHQNSDLPRLTGWWGYEESTRFQMTKGFKPSPDVDAWQLSNVPIMLLAIHQAALAIFQEAGIHNLRKKSEKLTGFLEFIVQEIAQETDFNILIITPNDSKSRGCQLSLLIPQNGKILFNELQTQGILADWREPDVIRIAPVPLYNTFEEVYQFGQILKKAIQEINS